MAALRPSTAVFGALAGVALAAWALLILGAGGMDVPTVCISAADWTVAAGVRLDLMLALNPPGRLAAGWALMLAAMMTPLLTAPLLHIRQRSLARMRPAAIALFVIGYGAVWAVAGAALAALAMAARLAAPGAAAPLVLAALAAFAWQASPAKQRCLNRCHRLPHLAAFGWAARRDALRFGLSHGAWCVGACWLLMLAPMLAGPAHLPVMAAVSLFLLAERLERPGPLTWRIRIPAKAARIIVMQTRMRLPHLAPRQGAGAVR